MNKETFYIGNNIIVIFSISTTFFHNKKEHQFRSQRFIKKNPVIY